MARDGRYQPAIEGCFRAMRCQRRSGEAMMPHCPAGAYLSPRLSVERSESMSRKRQRCRITFATDALRFEMPFAPRFLPLRPPYLKGVTFSIFTYFRRHRLSRRREESAASYGHDDIAGQPFISATGHYGAKPKPSATAFTEP